MPFSVFFVRLSGRLKRTVRLTGIESRKYPRVPLSVRVTTVKTGSFSFYHAHNISAGGMFLKSLEPPSKGTELHLRFSLFPDQEEIEVHGVVVWVQNPEPESSRVPGVGLQFTSVSPESRRTIERFVEMKL
jgi:uncharacterized protein (TIGR02266 family)